MNSFLSHLICLIIGGAAGLIYMYFRAKREAREMSEKLERLEQNKKMLNEDRAYLENKINKNGDVLVKKTRELKTATDKLEKIKKKAQAVKDDKKPDNIDDLINLL